MIDYRYLRAFMAAAKHLSFGKAAKELHISPSALSRQIALLERSSGSEVFVRNTRQVALTPFGKSLYASVARFERELDHALGEPPLRIGCLQSVFEFFLVGFMERHPGCFEGPLDIVIGSPEELQRQAMSGDLDLVITSRKPAPSSNLSGFRLFQESISWIDGAEGGNSSDRIIVFSAFEHAYLPSEKDAKNRIRVNSFDAAAAMARRKMGRSLLALPSKIRVERPSRGSQWIYAVMPSYRKAPDRLVKVIALLKKESS